MEVLVEERRLGDRQIRPCIRNLTGSLKSSDGRENH